MSPVAEATGALPFRARRAAYLVSRYPAFNHTFVLREIRGLRALGMDVRVASVLDPDRPSERLSPEEAEEARSTYYLRSQGAVASLTALARLLVSRPLAFLKGLELALRSSRWHLVTLVRHLRYLSEAAQTGLWMEGLGIDHLHTHFASTPALFARTMFPIRLSATIHGPDEFNDPIGFLLREKVHASELVVAISSYGKSQLMRFSDHRDWHKLAVVRLGVDPAEFAPGTRTKPEASPFEIICVGRLAPAKGQHVLLEACADLMRRGHRVLLRLVGDGPDRADLEIAAHTLGIDVIFHGALSHDRVLELYRQVDAFAIASFAEGVPVVLMEAMAMEIPCVATAITGVPELIQNEVDGLLVPAADSAALSAAIERLIADQELGRRLGQASRHKILLGYSLERNIRTLAEAFARIV